MNDIDRRVIQLHKKTLANETNFTVLWNELLVQNTDNIITPLLRQKYTELIRSSTSNYDLNLNFYDDIQTRGRQAFDLLVQCLKKQHAGLAELLLPNENPPDPEPHEDSPAESDDENPVYMGMCIVTGNHQSRNDVYYAVKKLCKSINAKLINNIEEIVLTDELDFHLNIHVKGKFSDDAIKELKILPCYINRPNFKIIIINIMSRGSDELDANADTFTSREPYESTSYEPSGVFIIDIHTHSDDHLPSVLRIIRKVVASNPRHEIRDIFHVVTDKLARWGCYLNTESRSFPPFFFNA